MIRASVQRLLNSFGYQIIRSRTSFTDEELAVLEAVKAFTATSAERLRGLINATKYIIENKIEGDFVECGVWRGGSMMAAMLALMRSGGATRHFHLFDTFQGMTEPTTEDVQFDGAPAEDLLNKNKKSEQSGIWCIAGLEEVKKNVLSTGYPKENIHFIQGRVEDTIPGKAPAKIALLRLDTDWYESTAHELKHLYHRLSAQGVLIIDDYGHWQGARKAVDEYFAGQDFRPLFNCLDYTGRLVIKPF